MKAPAKTFQDLEVWKSSHALVLRMIDLYSALAKKNNHSASCERVAGRRTAAILDAPHS
jgi:hypothetical protein